MVVLSHLEPYVQGHDPGVGGAEKTEGAQVSDLPEPSHQPRLLTSESLCERERNALLPGLSYHYLGVTILSVELTSNQSTPDPITFSCHVQQLSHLYFQPLQLSQALIPHFRYLLEASTEYPTRILNF